MRYFRLLALADPDWLASEFNDGRMRFGWSWPGMDLRVLATKSDLSEDEKIAWRYTQFLTNRIRRRDRIVCQFGQPFREFWIGEVIDPGYEFDADERKDFNHILHIQPLTDRPIPSTVDFVPSSLKHDLTKRGHYYEIYPEDSIRVLDRIVSDELWKTLDVKSVRTDAHELDESYLEIQTQIVSAIGHRWRAKDFETFCSRLCEAIPYVEVKIQQDSNQGWDILIRIINPVTAEVLLDDVPVQCKNYEGDVTDTRPIEDLERSIRNSKSDIAYLFILGELTDELLHKIDKSAEVLTRERNRKTTFVVVDQNRIASLYMTHVLGSYGEGEVEA